MGCSKAVLRGKCIAIQSYLKGQENYKTENLTLHLNQLIKEQQQQQQQAKNSKWKYIIRIRAEINEKEVKGRSPKVAEE